MYENIYKENLRIRAEETKEKANVTEKIAKDIDDLNQIMMDLSQIVDEQNNLVDSIEAHIETSANSVERSHQKLQKCVESKNAKIPLVAVGISSLAVGGPVGVATCSAIAGIAAGISAGKNEKSKIFSNLKIHLSRRFKKLISF